MCSAPEDMSFVMPYNDSSRKAIRSLIFHLLYTAETLDYQETLPSIADKFNRGFDLSIPLDGEVVTTAQAIIDHNDSLDEHYKPLLTNWKFDRISVCTKLILRYALWEILYTKTDRRIILNEAIELTKCFAERDAYRFVNGILDTFIKKEAPSIESSSLSE